MRLFTVFFKAILKVLTKCLTLIFLELRDPFANDETLELI